MPQSIQPLQQVQTESADMGGYRKASLPEKFGEMNHFASHFDQAMSLNMNENTQTKPYNKPSQMYFWKKFLSWLFKRQYEEPKKNLQTNRQQNVQMQRPQQNYKQNQQHSQHSQYHGGHGGQHQHQHQHQGQGQGHYEQQQHYGQHSSHQQNPKNFDQGQYYQSMEYQQQMGGGQFYGGMNYMNPQMQVYPNFGM